MFSIFNNKSGWKCINCQNLDVTLDIDTGKTVCNKCNSSDNIKKIDLEEYKNESIEKEEKEIVKIKTLGNKVGFNKDIFNIDKLNNLNDYI